MNQITTFLDDTTPEQFFALLEDISRHVCRVYPAETGQYSVDFSRKTGPLGAKIQATLAITVDLKENYASMEPDTGKLLVSQPLDVMIFNYLSAGKRLKLKIEYDTELPLVTHAYLVLSEIAKAYPGAFPQVEKFTGANVIIKEKTGRKFLERSELVYRVAKAEEGNEIKAGDYRKTWKEIAKEIGWRLGPSEAGVKLLEDARNRLERLKLNDPDGILTEVEEFRRKETKIT